MVNKIPKQWMLIFGLILLKLLIHFFTYSNYEPHRDAYLFYAQSQHLDWGYDSVPPTTAIIGWIATTIFGNTTFALRFFPAIIGALTLLLIGLMIWRLGGKHIAVLLAGLAFILSPIYLHLNTLLQPVSLNVFYWVLTAYLILLLIQRKDPRIWIWIAVVVGLAFLNKYSIVFFAVAFALSLLITPYRNLYWSRYFLIALGLGFFIILPNLIWQYNNGWPVVTHMEELHRTQLVHVQFFDFILFQFLVNVQAILIWLIGLFGLLFLKELKKYRIFGYIYLIVIILLILGKGKIYYSMGLYPVLFVFGAVLIEKYAKKYIIYVSVFLIIHMSVSLYMSLPFDGVPFISIEQAVQEDKFRWEDGTDHDIPQDMADMTGWTQLADHVVDIYLTLNEKDRANCEIYCTNYGQAGAIMFHGKKANIPQPVSFIENFADWSPDSLTKEYFIWVYSDMDYDQDPDSMLNDYFGEAKLQASVDDRFFRENGTKIYLCRYPTELLKNRYLRRREE